MSRTPPKVMVNNKGKKLSLLAASPDDKELKQYIENGAIDPKMTPAQVMKKFPQFQSFEYNCFVGALHRSRNLQVKQIKDRQSIGQGCKFEIIFKSLFNA